jgi:hypothetical protein
VGRAGRRTHDRGFGNWRVDHPLLAELLDEPFGHLEGATVVADVLAKNEDALVALHLFPHPLAQGFQVGDFRH